MKKELWQPIKDAHSDYWSDKIRTMPDGYANAITELFRLVTEISEGRQLITIDLWHYPGGGIVAGMRPRHDVDDVTDEQKASLFDLLKAWSLEGDRICQVCGRSPVSILKFMDSRPQEILCDAHFEVRRSSDE